MIKELQQIYVKEEKKHFEVKKPLLKTNFLSYTIYKMGKTQKKVQITRQIKCIH